MKTYTSVLISSTGKLAFQAELNGRMAALRKFVAERSSKEARSAGNGVSGRTIPGENSRQEQILHERINHLTLLINQAQVAPVPTDTKCVAIGHTASISYRIGRKKYREVHEIVGFDEGDCSTTPPKLSYNTPFAQAFLGESKGYQCTVWRGGRPIMMTLTNIRLPPKPKHAATSD